MPHPSLLIPIVAFAASVIAWRLARRGGRVDDHPVCRRCRFDLFAKPADSTRCPECGRDVSGPRGVRVGNRRVNRVGVVVAVAAILAAGGWLGVASYRTVLAVDWDRHKPVWWLLREAAGSDGSAADVALNELGRRVTDNELRGPVLAVAADHALSVQATADRPWRSGWSGLLEAARKAKVLDDARWWRYADQSLTVAVRVRPGLRVGDPVAYRVLAGAGRIGSASFQITQDGPTWTTLGGGPATSGEDIVLGCIEVGAVRPAACQDALHAPIDPSPSLLPSPGPQTFKVRFAYRVYDPDLRKTVGPIVREAQTPITLLPAGAPPPVRLVRDPAKQPSPRLTVRGSESFLSCPDGRTDSVEVDLTQSPDDAGGDKGIYRFDVVLIAAGREFPAGDWTESVTGTSCRIPVPTARPLTKVDVELRPSVRQALETFDVDTIWGEPIVFRDVPVER